MFVLVAAVLACSAPGSSETETPAVVTLVVTPDGGQTPTVDPASPAPTVPQGITCTVVQDVRIHSCIGISSSSVVGASVKGSTFTPTKWDGQNWYYGQVPGTGGPTWGWVSGLNSDGSTLVSCDGDKSALPKSYEPCPTPLPTATFTPLPPTDTPQPTATNTTPPNLCGNGIADTGESCGEPVFVGCTALYTCKSCKCVPKFVVPVTQIIVQP
jgi:hypothetical protein